ncbi:RadC family protein [Candidatus Mycalebacterium sp.]
MSRQPSNPHYAGHRERIRKKFLKEGLSAFADYEALELLLTYSIPRSDVKPTAKKLLKTFGTLSAVLDASPSELKKVADIGGSTAAFIRLVREINWRYMETRIEKEDYLTSPQAVVDFCKSRIGRESNEFMLVVFVNTKNQFIEHEVVSEGGVASVNMNIRDIVKKAINIEKCSGIIIVHNHPSGHPQPSDSDKDLTEEMVGICKSLDIRLVDHLIVCSHDHYSFVENGLL